MLMNHSCPELSLGLKKVQDIRPLYHDSVVFWVLEKAGFKIFYLALFSQSHFQDIYLPNDGKKLEQNH